MRLKVTLQNGETFEWADGQIKADKALKYRVECAFQDETELDDRFGCEPRVTGYAAAMQRSDAFLDLIRAVYPQATYEWLELPAPEDASVVH